MKPQDNPEPNKTLIPPCCEDCEVEDCDEQSCSKRRDEIERQKKQDVTEAQGMYEAFIESPIVRRDGENNGS